MYRTIHELNAEEFAEIKAAYCDELGALDDEVPDADVAEHYDGILFVDDDFFCNIHDDNYECCGAAYSGLMEG